MKTKSKFGWGLLVLLVLCSAAMAFTTINVPVDQPTIQDAVNAASNGDTILVAAGSYNELLSVNKSVTLRGANWGIHPAIGTHISEVVGARGAETYLTHNGLYAINPSADNITVDGFVFNGGGSRTVDTYANANNFHLTNCIFADNTTSSGTGRIQFGGGSHTSCTFDFNLFVDRSESMIYTGGGPWDGLNVSYNKFVVEGNSVFWTATTMVNGVIQGNEFDGTVGGTPGAGFCGLNIGQGGNITIDHNHFHHLNSTAFQVGIIGGSVTNNIFDHIYPYVGGPFGDAFQLWGGQYGTPVSSNVAITGNEIHFNDVAGSSYPTHGPRLRAPDDEAGIDGSTIHINNNKFLDGGVRGDAYALRHQGNAATTVDAECNYWTAMTYAGIQAKIQGLADVDPWSDSGMNCIYTQPTPVHNITQNTDYTTIQLAINAAATGDTIECDAGSYPENVTLNKSLTLRGAQWGVNACGRSAGESIITAAGDIMTLNTGVAGSVIDGFTFSGGVRGITSNTGPLNNVMIRNNRVIGFTNGAMFMNDSGIDLTIDQNDMDGTSKTSSGGTLHFDTDAFPGLYVTNNCIHVGTGYGIFVDGNRNVAPSGSRNPLIGGNTIANMNSATNFGYRSLQDATITLNTFSNNTFDGFYGGPKNCTITRNTFTGNLRGGVVLSSGGNTTDPTKGAQTSVISENFFSGNATDIIFGSEYVGNIASNSVFNNSLLSAGAVSYSGGDIVNCSGNWWNNNTGPTVTNHPSGTGGTITGTASGNIDFTPWLNVGTDTDLGTAGFQGSHSTLWVDDDSPQVGATTRIQEGINSVSGSIVNILPGTYNENDVINVAALTLNGSGSGTNPASNTIINGGGGVGIEIDVAGTSALARTQIKNLRVTGCSTGINVAQANASYMTYDNVASVSNSVHGLHMNIVGSGACADIVVNNSSFSSNGQVGFRFPTYVGCDGLTITNSFFDGNQYGLYDERSAGTPILDHVTITGSSFSNDLYKGMYLEALDHATLTNIVVNNSGTGASSPCGIDINLKYGVYSTISFVNPTVTNSGTGAANGSGLTVKGRNDGSYSGNPATLSSLLVDGGTFTGCPNNVSIGNNVTAAEIRNAYTATATVAGIVMWTDAGTTANIHDNRLSGNAVNAVDTQSGHTWNANCYSDYGPAQVSGGYPDYNISGGGGNVDLNPNVNSCSNVDFIASSAYIGCPGGCAKDTLYLTFDQVGYINGQIIVQLPAQFDGDWAAGPGDVVVMPASNVSPNLYFSHAMRTGSNQIEVNVAWSSPYSNGDASKYIAAIPLKNVSGTDGNTYTISGVSSLFSNPGPHVNEFLLGSVSITVDCTGPTASLTVGAACAYKNAASLVNAFTTAMSAVGAPLDHAFVRVTNGTPASTDFTVSIAGGTWPNSGVETTVWAAMTEGCNDFQLHAFDTECNETLSMPVLAVIKDTQAPAPSVAYTQSACYNNISGDPQYGATLLATDLDIDLAGALTCQAPTFSLSFKVNGSPIAEGLSGVGSIADYPDATQAQNFWNQLVVVVGGGFSGSVSIDWTATDCAGNSATGNFSIPCVDFSAPTNTFTVFDARPTYNGVWLKWTWSAGSGATEMEVWRKGEGDYPVYSGDLSMSDANYEKVHANLVTNGWTKAVDQLASNFTAADYHANGDTHHTDVSTDDYWKDVIGDASRDIYRYVTFVRDAAGNWSQVASYLPSQLTIKADRSTNYWLGDYSYDVGDPAGSRGVVEGVDLGLLSAHYFESVGPAPSYLDIGPENHENAYGKGIPNPDQFVNFQDLMPFSFNYGVTGATSFHMQVPTRGDFEQLDALPVIAVTRSTDAPIEVGTEFTVNVTLSGNTENATKIAEARIEYDPAVLEFVDATAAGAPVFDGVAFSVARAVEGTSNTIGVVSGAMGEIAVLNGDFTMATLTFRWKSDQVANASFRVASVKLADAYGHVIDTEGSIFGFGATGIIPTSYALYQNYPNPFNPTTTIRYDLPEDAQVRLVIYNMMGQEVRTLINGTMPAGTHNITWDGLNNGSQSVGTGLYIYRITANNFSATHKMLLTR